MISTIGVTMKNSAEMISRLRIFQSSRRRMMPSRRTHARMTVSQRKNWKVPVLRRNKRDEGPRGQQDDGQVEFAKLVQHGEIIV